MRDKRHRYLHNQIDKAKKIYDDKYFSKYPTEVFERMSPVEKRQAWREAVIGKMEV